MKIGEQLSNQNATQQPERCPGRTSTEYQKMAHMMIDTALTSPVSRPHGLQEYNEKASWEDHDDLVNMGGHDQISG